MTAISGKHSNTSAASMSDCKTCKGTGWIRIRDWFDPTDTVPDFCHDCDGSGNADDATKDYSQITAVVQLPR